MRPRRSELDITDPRHDWTFRRKGMRRRDLLISSLAALALLAGACGGGSSGNNNNAQKTVGGVLTIDNESGALWQCDFNPYNGSVNGQSFGVLYEPLVYDNLLNDKKTPWLASDYQWSADNKTLTFTIRSGVTWTDGQPLTAADVVFSFALLKQHPEADLQSDWQVIQSVIQQGDDKVAFTFNQSAVPNVYQIAWQTAIVPQHIWSAFKDPAAQVVKAPVGTGPFTMSACTGQNIAYKRNPSYWQKGLPYLDTVNYPAFLDNDPANAFLAAGQAQWGGQFIPNIDTYYVAKDPKNNHYWFPPIDNINVWFNTTLAPLNNKAVRQAIAYLDGELAEPAAESPWRRDCDCCSCWLGCPSLASRSRSATAVESSWPGQTFTIRVGD